jgi:hypothetical protein
VDVPCRSVRRTLPILQNGRFGRRTTVGHASVRLCSLLYAGSSAAWGVRSCASASQLVSHLVFVGERRSRRARAMGVSWSDGRLAACTLHAALRACGIDPTTVTFVNLFQDRDDRWELELEVLAQVLQLAATGATIIALGQRVHRAFERAQLHHLHAIHPAARGRIRARARYQAHVAAVLNSSAPDSLSEAGAQQS